MFDHRPFFIVGLLLVFSVCLRSVSAQERINQSIYTSDTGETIYDVEWNPCRDIIAAATWPGVHIYDATLQLLTELDLGRSSVSVSWNPSGTEIVVSGVETGIWQWDSASSSLNLVRTIAVRSSTVIWSPDGTKIATITNELVYPDALNLMAGTIRIWNATDGQLLHQITGKYLIDATQAVGDLLTWSPDGSSLAFAGNGIEITADNDIMATSYLEIKIWNTENGQLVNTIRMIGALDVMSLKWHPFNNLIAVGTDSGVDVYNLVTQTLLTSAGIGADLDSLSWSPDGNYLASGSSIVNPFTNSFLGLFSGAGDHTGSVSWRSDGSRTALVTRNSRLSIENPGLLADYSPDITQSGIDCTLVNEVTDEER